MQESIYVILTIFPSLFAVHRCKSSLEGGHRHRLYSVRGRGREAQGRVDLVKLEVLLELG